MFVDTWVQGKYNPLLFLKREQAQKDTRIKWKMVLSKA